MLTLSLLAQVRDVSSSELLAAPPHQALDHVFEAVDETSTLFSGLRNITLDLTVVL